MATDADVILLSLLAEQPRHAYELDRLIEERGYRSWTSLGTSSVYYVVKRLHERGLAAPVRADGGRRTVYELTPAGRRELERASAERVRAPDAPSASILTALGAYASLEDPRLRAHLAERAAALAEQIARLQRGADAAPHPIARAIFEFELARHQAEAEWIRRTIRPDQEARDAH